MTTDEAERTEPAQALAASVELAAHMFAPVSKAIADGKIAGAVLGLCLPDQPIAVQADGVLRRDAPGTWPVTAESIYDLASLTKAIFTTTTILQLVQSGAMDLDDPLSRFLPDLHQYDMTHPVRRLTVRQCLAHRSGLPAVEPVYTWGKDVDQLKALILQRDWPLGPPVYSDINFIFLGLVIERLTSQPLAVLATAAGFPPPSSGHLVAATEWCSWRGRMICGDVHDENASALGGIAGHAGLFANAASVLAFARSLMDGKLLSTATLSEMTRPQAGGTRGLGWELKTDGWSGGGLSPPGSIGHTGFTGTGLWLNLASGVAWVLLTNRVHPTRHVDSGIQDLRRAVGNRLWGNAIVDPYITGRKS